MPDGTLVVSIIPAILHVHHPCMSLCITVVCIHEVIRSRSTTRITFQQGVSLRNYTLLKIESYNNFVLVGKYKCLFGGGVKGELHDGSKNCDSPKFASPLLT